MPLERLGHEPIDIKKVSMEGLEKKELPFDLEREITEDDWSQWTRRFSDNRKAGKYGDLALDANELASIDFDRTVKLLTENDFDEMERARMRARNTSEESYINIFCAQLRLFPKKIDPSVKAEYILRLHSRIDARRAQVGVTDDLENLSYIDKDLAKKKSAEIDWDFMAEEYARISKRMPAWLINRIADLSTFDKERALKLYKKEYVKAAISEMREDRKKGDWYIVAIKAGALIKVSKLFGAQAKSARERLPIQKKF